VELLTLHWSDYPIFSKAVGDESFRFDIHDPLLEIIVT
jgi:hypothetical protein